MQQDLLGREPFIGLLDNIVTKKIKGFSFAIDGKWGCGKSWILKELEKKLEPRFFVVHYNCWENEYYEEPLMAILSVIIDKLNENESLTQEENKKNTLKIAADFLTDAASIVAKNKIGIDFGELKKAGKKAIKADKEPTFETDFDKNQSLKIAIKKVREGLLKLKEDLGGFVLIVDELDRCLPEYAIKAMQRLHHICFDTVSDTYIFVQLAAINKSELLGSIAKTFGREFNLTQKYTIAEHQKPGLISYDNFEEVQNRFGNYYFKKFFQMIIPVSNGEEVDDSLSILEGFEKNFDPNDTAGKKYVQKLFTDVFSLLPMRAKLELVHQVETVHEITALDNSLDKNLTYKVLCVEFIDALCKSVLKTDYPVINYNESNQHVDFLLRIPKLSNIEGISDFKVFYDAFSRWSIAGYTLKTDTIWYTIKSEFELKTPGPASYVKAFYQTKESSLYKRATPIIIEETPTTSADEKFIEAFRKNLEILV